ncbi:MAG TPA: TMEM165/GDT1 family protein [Gemmatimonadales bacterium]
MLALFFATYGAVFVAEIVGDKLLYTTGVLATRYRPTPIVIGVTIAFMAKMAVAVMFGKVISHLPPLLVAGLTTASFVGVAVVLWHKPVTREQRQARDRDHTHPGKATGVSFATIFFSEWGDVGQITAATMAARFPSPLIVWAGAVAAMVTKGALAASVGAGARRWIDAHLSPRVIRVAGVSALILLGLLSAIETLTEGHA